MLQARTRDYILVTSDGQLGGNITGSYYEPGFNIMSPLEFEFPVSDRISFRIRKRANTDGDVLSAINIATMTVTVTDPTNGQSVLFLIENDGSTHLILYITNGLNLANPVARVRTMDVHIKDSDDDDFLTFRVMVDDQDKNFHYIFAATNDMGDRSSFTAQGRDVNVFVNSSSDHYILFSPYAFFRETTIDEAEFSYPLNTIFYKRQDSYNDEDYTFSISSYSNTFIRSVVSVMNVPSYNKACVLLIDRRIYKDIIENGVNPYIDIAVNGELSGLSDTFRVNFTV